MAKSGSEGIKSLEEILKDMRNNPNTRNASHNDELTKRKIVEAVEAIYQKIDDAKTLSVEERNMLSGETVLLHNPWLPEEYAESLSELLVDIEELLYLYGPTNGFSLLATSHYVDGHCKKRSEAVSIKIRPYEILIRLPYLPKKYNGAKDLCNQMLAAKIYHTRGFPKWSSWTARYYHIFPSTLTSIPKDVDNYEYKRTNDILAYALGSSDNALRFSMTMTTIFTDKLAPGTYIHVTPKSSENIDFLIEVFKPEKEETPEKNDKTPAGK